MPIVFVVKVSGKFGPTFGMFVLEPVSWVAMVSTVVTPREILAGTASTLIQKETQERITIRTEGM